MFKKLLKIQTELKAPKNQHNSFGGYNYRSCEDILEAVKPLLKDNDLTMSISDDIVMLGDRYYVKATVTISDGKVEHSVNAFARETLSKKKSDDSQITGAASSYARKYALNGMFLIDDTKDADATNNGEKTKSDSTLVKKCAKIKQEINQCSNIEQLTEYFKLAEKQIEEVRKENENYANSLLKVKSDKEKELKNAE
jgi:hypothetical protein